MLLECMVFEMRCKVFLQMLGLYTILQKGNADDAKEKSNSNGDITKTDRRADL